MKSANPKLHLLFIFENKNNRQLAFKPLIAYVFELILRGYYISQILTHFSKEANLSVLTGINSCAT